MRQSVREKEHELVALRQHVDLLFAERARHDELVQQLEAQVQQAKAETQQAKDQHSWERLASAESSETALTAQRSNGDLRRRLSSQTHAAREALCASAEKDSRIAELERQLAEKDSRIAELVSSGQPRPCMQRSNSALESLGGTHTPRADDSSKTLQASLSKGLQGRRSLPARVEEEKDTPQDSARQGKKKRVSTGTNSQSSLQVR